MDDRFLHDLRRDPPAIFARRLRAELDRQEWRSAAWDTRRRAAKWLSLAASIAAVSVAFTFPTVRAGAQAFLDLFRVSSFVAVPLDVEQLRRIEVRGLDLTRLLGDDVQVLAESGAPRSYASAEEAGGAVGLRLVQPAWLPPGWQRAGIEVAGEHAVQVTPRTANLQFLLDQLGFDDLTVPAALDGQPATIRIPPIALQLYTSDGQALDESEARRLEQLHAGSQILSLFQARHPEVGLPQGLELSALAEIALRVLGVEREEAYRLATTVDWRSTLLVPVPVAEKVRHVNVAGRDGLLIEARARGTVLWSREDRVLALNAPLPPDQLLAIAESVQ